MIKIGKQPWSYKNIVNITNWIVNKLLKNCIFTDNLLTNEIYKFGCIIGNYKLIKYAFDKKSYVFEISLLFIKRPWSKGMILTFQVGEPGSSPGGRIFL